MIPLAPAVDQAAVTPAAGWNMADLIREMIASWLAHHQRLADMGLSPDI